eukprot:9149524-Alexandrium_andersonii.AAC.1
MERSQQAPRGRSGRRDRNPPQPAIPGTRPAIQDHLGQYPRGITGGRPALETPRAGLQVSGRASSTGLFLGFLSGEGLIRRVDGTATRTVADPAHKPLGRFSRAEGATRVRREGQEAHLPEEADCPP